MCATSARITIACIISRWRSSRFCPNRLRLYESNRLFPLLLTFAHTLGRERVFTRLVTGIALLEEDYPEADLACCGFPENWREILENEIS